MVYARRSNGVDVRTKGLATDSLLVIPDDKVAGNEIDFFLVFVNKCLGCIDARREAKQT